MKNTDLTKMKNYLNKNGLNFSIKIVNEKKTLLYVNGTSLRFAYSTIEDLNQNEAIVGGYDLDQYFEMFTNSHGKAVNIIKEYLK